VSPRPTALELKALYDDEYFSHDELASCLQFRTPVFDQCLARLLRLVGVNHRKILDVGCGTGEFVAHAISKGWDATGIESSATAARFARNENGLPVHHAVLETELFPTNSFDVVTLLDVLEHLLMPCDEMRRVFALLKPGGVAVVRVPNVVFHLTKARIISRLGISESSLEMRYHLNHFSPRTLTELLRRIGFQMIAVEVGAAETKAHAAWANPNAKRGYVKAAAALRAISGINLGNIMVAYARKPL
jgi:2-polyprenyl-3-methyl-5-hydroxy-6-metoxy-1,4-benzoquinol methylase